MNEPSKGVSHTEASRRPVGPVDSILSGLASLKFALVVVLLIALACVAGTLIPQGSQVDPFLERYPGARRVMDVLAMLDLTRVFYAWWFVGLLSVFAASLAACTARRYALIRRTTGASRVRLIGSFITHVSLMLVLAGGVVRVIWGQKGTIQLHEGEVAGQVESSEGPIVLPFSVRLSKFELEFHENPGSPAGGSDRLQVQWAEKKLQTEFPIDLKVEHPVIPADAPAGSEPAFKVTILRYVPDFSIDGSNGEVQSRSREPNNPAIQVLVTGGGGSNTQWVFSRFPDFSKHGGPEGAAAPMPLMFRFVSAQSLMTMGRQAPIKAFKSTLEVLEGDAVVSTRTIAVNSPFSYRGYTFYQLSYDPDDLSWSALQVVKDPGVPIVYGGFILMMAGLTLVFGVGSWRGSSSQAKGGTV